MTPVPDPYRMLGVPRGATLDQIKSAHRALAKRYHPDAAAADTTRFLAVQEAYQLLSDPLRRRDWDAQHSAGPVRAGEGMPRTAPPRPQGGTAGGRGRTGANGGSNAGAGATGRRPGRPNGQAPSPDDDDTRQANGPWTASDRDPAARAYTWSAAGVPWWEDDLPREARRPPGARRGRGAGRAGDPSGATPGDASGPVGEARSASTGAGAGPAAGARSNPGGSGAAPGAAAAGRSKGRRSASDPTVDGSAGPDASAAPRAPDQAGPNEFDVYSRSSGAAWSSASRKFFRRGNADLPRRGVFRMEGTTVVTGAAARRAAERDAPPPAGPQPPDATGRPDPEAHRAPRWTDARAGAPAPGPSAGRRPTAATPPAGADQAPPTARRAAPASAGPATPPASGAHRAPPAWTTSGPERSTSTASSNARSAPSGGAQGANPTMGTMRNPLASAWQAAMERRVPWPSLRERITIAALAWVPLAIVIGYGGAWATGCDRAAASCPDAAESVQAALLLATLALFVALPRVAYLAAWGAAGLMLAGLVLAVPASIMGNRFEIPLVFVGFGVGALVASYVAGIVLAARDRPVPRPWTLPDRRRLPTSVPR